MFRTDLDLVILYRYQRRTVFINVTLLTITWLFPLALSFLRFLNIALCSRNHIKFDIHWFHCILALHQFMALPASRVTSLPYVRCAVAPSVRTIIFTDASDDNDTKRVVICRRATSPLPDVSVVISRKYVLRATVDRPRNGLADRKCNLLRMRCCIVYRPTASDECCRVSDITRLFPTPVNDRRVGITRPSPGTHVAAD